MGIGMGIGTSMFPHQWVQSPELMIISTIHSKPCKYSPGDHYNFMSIVNKQACRLYSFPERRCQADRSLLKTVHRLMSEQTSLHKCM